MNNLWLTAEEVADLLKVSKLTVTKWARNGWIPASKIIGQWRFNSVLLDAWISAKTVGVKSNIK